MPSTCGFKDPVTGLRDCPEPRWKAGATYCSHHEAVYREMRRTAKANGDVTPSRKTPAFTGVKVTLSDAPVSTGDRTHEYIVNPELGALWNCELAGMAQGDPGGAFLFFGPAGSGKTDGAEALAAMTGLEFTAVDAASMTDPEAWFGTREIVVQDGVAVTDYRPSVFAESIQKPGVTYIDEITRCRPEGINILIPVLDHTRKVTNPLTGEIIHRHPQNIIIMGGNVGVNFVGTNAVDPAFWTRATKVEFNYLPEDEEKKVLMDATGVDIDTAYVLVRFANDTRQKAQNDDEFTAISTRELLTTAKRVARGLDRDLAVKFEILMGTSNEGGNASLRNELNNIWNGVRAAKDPSNAPKAPAAGPTASTSSDWTCPTHGTVKVIPAGTSAKTGKAYASFRACGSFGCPMTEDNSKNIPNASIKQSQAAAGTAGLVCGDCGHTNPPGRTTICSNCGSTL